MTFDANSFLDSTVSGANDTKTVPVPVGEYMAIISKIAPRQWQSKDGTSSGVALDIFWAIEDTQVKAELGRDEVICKQGLMLDLNADGTLDMSKGKNVALGRLREAVGKNSPSEPFSFAMLPGLSARVSVKHRMGQNDGEVFAEVKGVAKL
jgi:hypothetical protein